MTMPERSASRTFSWVEFNDLVEKGAELIKPIVSVPLPGGWYRFSQLLGGRAYKEYLAQFGLDPRTLSICSNDLRSFIDLPKLLLATNGLGSRVHKFFPQVYLLPTGTNPYSQNMGRTNTDLKLANEPMTNSEPPSLKGPKAGIPIDDEASANRKQLLDRRALNARVGETFTIEEAAIILNVSQSSIRRWSQDGGDLTRVKKPRGRVTALSVKRLKFPETEA
jgi:hypothetical protein